MSEPEALYIVLVRSGPNGEWRGLNPAGTHWEYAYLRENLGRFSKPDADLAAAAWADYGWEVRYEEVPRCHDDRR
jgi:hypothetical protein